MNRSKLASQLIVIAVGFLQLLAAESLHAVPIRIEFTGRIESLDDVRGTNPGLRIGDTVSGAVRYQTNGSYLTTIGGAGGNRGTYRAAHGQRLIEAGVRIGPHSFGTNATDATGYSELSFVNNFGLNDFIQLDAYIATAGSFAGGGAFNWLGIGFSDTTLPLDLLSSPAIAEIPNFDGPLNGGGILESADAFTFGIDYHWSAFFTITSARFSIPESASLWLIGLGLASLLSQRTKGVGGIKF